MDINNLMSWLRRTHHVNVSNEWMRQALGEVKSSFRNCSLNCIQEEVWKKWLATDLHSLPNLCLPKNLQNQKKQNVNGTFVLQIDEIRDISKACYSQLMKTTNQDEENLNVEDKSKKSFEKEKPSRVLKLNLSDGIENVFGMEYKPIPFLNTSIPSGSKICLRGNFTCRLGTFLLTKENVKFLGGGVEALKEENTQEKVLARALGNEETLLKLCSDNQQKPTVKTSNNQTKREPTPSTNDGDLGDDFIDFAELERLENIAIQSMRNDDDNCDFDDDFIDFEELDKMERQAVQKIENSSRNKIDKVREFKQPIPNSIVSEKRKSDVLHTVKMVSNSTCDVWNDDFDEDFAIVCEVTPKLKSLQPAPKKQCLETKNNVECSSNSREHLIKRKILTNNDIHLPFTYLRNILNTPATRRKKNYTVKGFFMTLTKPLDHNSETKWSLEALINDGTESLDVTLDDEVLENMIGFKANEIRSLSRRAKYDSGIREKIDKGFENCKTTLTNFTGLIDLEFSIDDKTLIIKIRDLTEDDVRLVSLAIDDSDLPAEFRKS